MRDNSVRILLTLAASRFNENDLYAFFREVERRGAVRTTDLIVDLRAGRAFDGDRSIRSKPSKLRPPKSTNRKKIAADVEAVLVDSAGLQKKDAIRILQAELERRYGENSEWPSTNKVAFDLWVSRLVDQISPSELMHIATQVRNDLVHGRRSISDWPLSDG